MKDMVDLIPFLQQRNESSRVQNLRGRVRAAMEVEPVPWQCPARIDERFMSEALPVRKARAIATKLAEMPTDLWSEQLFAGSMTLESPRIHAEWGFPDYVTDEERTAAQERDLSIYSVFGHIVPDYPILLAKGLLGIRTDAEGQRPLAQTPEELAFLDSVVIAVNAVMDFASRLAVRCQADADACPDPTRANELQQMAQNLCQSPAKPAETGWQALQAVWLLHMVFHSTLDVNALGRVDQYVWPYFNQDLLTGRMTLEMVSELVDCFCLKFNERAKATEEQHPEAREAERIDAGQRTRHYTSSQLGSHRDGLDATNHWLQNIVIGGLTPDGNDATNPLSYLLLDSYRRHQMTNPLLVVRLHTASPDELVAFTCETLKDGGGMPALFNDEAIIPALEHVGISTADARDYTNDGCWEVIIPGRTDFRFLRISPMLCLEWVLNRGKSRIDNSPGGIDTGDPTLFTSFDDVWQAYLAQLDHMVAGVVQRMMATINERFTIAPVPLLSALIDGAISSRRDLTAGGAKYRTYGMLIESAAHTIDALVAIKQVVFEQHEASMSELCAALDTNYAGFTALRSRLLAAPKYGNDDPCADELGYAMIQAFADIVARHARPYQQQMLFLCGVGTFSWYIGIGEGLGASPDGRLAGEPVSSNFSPALGRDMEGIPGAILSYARMHEGALLPAGGPLDLRIARKLIAGEEGTARMAALLRSFVSTGGNMMTLTVADSEELRAAQRDPDKYTSLRVRMGGWCAYFTMLSREQQDHHLLRQEGRS